MAGHTTDDEIDAALLLDELEHTSCHHGDDDKFSHADDTVAHGSKPSVDIEATRHHSDDARQDNTQGEYRHHVHSEDGCYEYCEVGYDLHPLYVGYMLWGTYTRAHEDIDDEDDDCCRDDDERVDAKLIREPTSLSGCGYDGGVGDEREVVAKEGTANDHCCHEGNVGTRLLGYSCRDRCESHDGTHTRAYRNRYETGCHEESREQHLWG